MSAPVCVFCRLGHGDLVMEGSVSAPVCVFCRLGHGDLVMEGSVSAPVCVFCRLGHGDLVMEGSVSAPVCVQTFHMLHIRVEAVACGGEHTLAITQQGVGTYLKFTLHTSKYTLHTHQGGLWG